MKQFIRDYFTFNKRERNGILVLILIIFFEILYLNFSHLFVSSKRIDEAAFFENKNQQTLIIGKQLTVNNNQLKTNNQLTRLFQFNPNKLSAKDWALLGLSDKQIRVIKNYEAKGGRFYSKADVKKMYCISQKQYLQLEPYILIPDFQNTSPVANTSLATNNSKIVTKNITPLIVELNSADSLQLLSIKGIGAFYARTIIKYRNLLGGFYSKNQLLEVWKFDENKLHEIESLISVDSGMIKKININTCDAKQLKHPYLKWNQVNAIINYRKHHGVYKSIAEVKNTDLIDELTFNKIAHYLTTQ